MSPSPFSLPSFVARVVKGAGRGRTIGSPTLNLALKEIPRTLKNGIFACRVAWNRRTFAAAMHFGPRPVFGNSITCEVHVIDSLIRRAPLHVKVEVVKRLRGIRNFRTVGLLQKQIEKDLRQARTILFQ